MKEIFSGESDELHYRPRIVDLTHIDDLPPPMNEEGRPILDVDWELPDAMVVRFPKQDS